MDTTLDGLLNQRVQLIQPRHGYRVALDTVFLAAAVSAVPQDRILDLGCGAGGAMLSLAVRIEDLHIIGVESQDDFVALCQKNIELNGFSSKLEVFKGDARNLSEVYREKFDYVMINPPYHVDKKHTSSPDSTKRTANTEEDGDLPLWIKNAAYALREKGQLVLIHRADRMEEICGILEPLFGKVELVRLRPKAGAEPKRVIVKAKKAAKFEEIHPKDFILHKDDGTYTIQTEAILRHLGALEFGVA